MYLKIAGRDAFKSGSQMSTIRLLPGAAIRTPTSIGYCPIVNRSITREFPKGRVIPTQSMVRLRLPEAFSIHGLIGTVLDGIWHLKAERRTFLPKHTPLLARNRARSSASLTRLETKSDCHAKQMATSRRSSL